MKKSSRFRALVSGAIAIMASLPSVLLLGSAEVLAEDGCPKIEGPYVRQADNLIIDWSQDGCSISANSPSGGFDHEVTGKWNGSRFNTRVVRKNIANGCTTTMYGRLYVVNATTLTSEVIGTDGRCDLPANYSESSLWTKR